MLQLQSPSFQVVGSVTRTSLLYNHHKERMAEYTVAFYLNRASALPKRVQDGFKNIHNLCFDVPRSQIHA